VTQPTTIPLSFLKWPFRWRRKRQAMPASESEVYVVTLRPLPGVNGIRALRHAPKWLLPRHGGKCFQNGRRSTDQCGDDWRATVAAWVAWFAPMPIDQAAYHRAGFVLACECRRPHEHPARQFVVVLP
jgi:hypothetical protein